MYGWFLLKQFSTLASLTFTALIFKWHLPLHSQVVFFKYFPNSVIFKKGFQQALETCGSYHIRLSSQMDI